ncbi:MAG: molybdopterin converting factor subunit 1 [Sandaracinaceae bacterium]
MRVRVLYFAVVRERLGLSEELVELEAPSDVRGLADVLTARHPTLAEWIPRIRFALNEELCDASAALRDGDVVALIPPVAGGAPDRAADRVALRSSALSMDEVAALVKHPGAGALALFAGWVRDHHEGRRVSALEYSAYETMALREMIAIVEELEREHDGVRLAVHHRIGALAIGDTAVLCAASAAHREEAFVAGRALIDRIKERAPIWKKETTDDGVVWVGSGEPPEPR